MNKFTTQSNTNAPQAEERQKVKSFYQEFEENKKYMEQFVVDCVISVMEGWRKWANLVYIENMIDTSEIAQEDSAITMINTSEIAQEDSAITMGMDSWEIYLL